MQGYMNTEEIIARNQNEYPDLYDEMKWLSPARARKVKKTRQQLLDDILQHSAARWEFQDTKLFTHTLSPGCACCGNGDWSCLFINGICNARCFYCPSSQNDPGLPMANTLTFEHPEAYTDFVNRFHIKGVSFSGGEPLLTFDRVQNFLEVLKSKADHDVYTWMYTNGLLVTSEKLTALKNSGLDEIRFDLSADDYKLSALEKALGIIPRVTVEIPAIPEDQSRTRELIRTLHQMGANHLNLHQIRCTPFNSRKLIRRGYTFIHGPKVTVLDTELTALELIRYSLDQDIALPINYCSFTFRNQFQGAAARKRYAQEIKASYETMTHTGYIRQTKATGDPKEIESIHRTLTSAGADTDQFHLNGKKDGLSFSAGLLPLIDLSKVRINISYSSAVIRPNVSYRHPFKTIHLNGSNRVVIEKQPARPAIALDKIQIEALKTFLISKEPLTNPDHTGILRKILPFESFQPGLAPYY